MKCQKVPNTPAQLQMQSTQQDVLCEESRGLGRALLAWQGPPRERRSTSGSRSAFSIWDFSVVVIILECFWLSDTTLASRETVFWRHIPALHLTGRHRVLYILALGIHCTKASDCAGDCRAELGMHMACCYARPRSHSQPPICKGLLVVSPTSTARAAPSSSFRSCSQQIVKVTVCTTHSNIAKKN
jgi:hypothetical protein